MRSTGIPVNTPRAGITRIIRMRSESVVVSRLTESTNDFDQTTTTSTDHTEDMWLAEPDEGEILEIAGERIEGSLAGLVVSDGSVDLKHSDRITHGGVEYELDTVVGQPVDGEVGGNTDDVDFWVVSFTRRQ